MSGKRMDSSLQHGEFLVYEAEDGRVKLEVRLQDETVWLTQADMAELFQTTQQNISQHILNIYEEGELEPGATYNKFLSVRHEGSRQVQRRLDFYNLDMIISVGYRVKSHVTTRFRIWATQRLKEYIVKDFTMDDERLKNPDNRIEKKRVFAFLHPRSSHARLSKGRVGVDERSPRNRYATMKF